MAELEVSRTLVLAPSIALVGQTLHQWTMHRTKPFTYLAVCSDKSIQDEIEADDEQFDVSASEIGVAVTTTPEEVKTWLEATRKSRQYIFSTYHSADVIEKAVGELGDYEFDVIIFDEAHRTVGRADQQFGVALSNDRIPSRKRLFMTATERLINPRVKSLASQSGKEILSMDDSIKYGPTLHEYNFGSAIRDGVIADYEIVLAEVSGQEHQRLLEVNQLLQLEPIEEEIDPIELSADELFKASFLLKAVGLEEVNKVLTFHALQRQAASFSKCLQLLVPRIDEVKTREPYITYVLGSHNAGERAEKISFFEQAGVGVLSNVHVLSEGVDIPLIDSVYFVGSKTSLIDLVQAIGRALRKPYGTSKDKIAKIIVPIRIPPDVTSLDEIDWEDSLSTLHYVIQAMRDQDQSLSEQINEINQYVITGGRKGYQFGSAAGSKLRVSAPALKLSKTIDFDAFLRKITLRIATANANPEGATIWFSHLGKGERTSDYKPSFGILGDYNPDTYNESLVAPTLECFPNTESITKADEIKINHNNVSHSRRLGLIEDVDDKKFRLTLLGKMLKNQELNFEQVFMNQMMLYSTRNDLYPYRIIMHLLIQLETISYIEFLYGPYIIEEIQPGIFDLESAVQRILFIRENFPNIEVTNKSNRDLVRTRLNDISPVDLPDEYVWGDRLTLANKYRYIKNHMSLFREIDNGDGGFRTPLHLRDPDIGGELLERSNPIQAPKTAYYGNWIWLLL